MDFDLTPAQAEIRDSVGYNRGKKNENQESRMNRIWIAFALVMAVAGCSREKADTRSTGEAAGRAVANAVLQISDADASALWDITGKLEGACARNRFGLTEEACIQTIRTRKDACIQQTAQKYPGQLANVDRMQEVASTYVNCLFQR